MAYRFCHKRSWQYLRQLNNNQGRKALGTKINY